MIYLLNGEPIIGQFTLDDGTSYPENWCTLVSEEERVAIGIVTLTEVYPEITEGQMYSRTYTDDLVGLTRTYTVVDVEPNQNA